MSADLIQKYVDARRNLQSAEHSLKVLVNIIHDAASKLKHPQNVMISNCTVGFPMDAALSGISIDARTWPTGEQLAEALVAWHSARRIAENTYFAIPEGDRLVLVPLDK